MLLWKVLLVVNAWAMLSVKWTVSNTKTAKQPSLLTPVCSCCLCARWYFGPLTEGALSFGPQKCIHALVSYQLCIQCPSFRHFPPWALCPEVVSDWRCKTSCVHQVEDRSRIWSWGWACKRYLLHGDTFSCLFSVTCSKRDNVISVTWSTAFWERWWESQVCRCFILSYVYKWVLLQKCSVNLDPMGQEEWSRSCALSLTLILDFGYWGPSVVCCSGSYWPGLWASQTYRCQNGRKPTRNLSNEKQSSEKRLPCIN